MTKYDNTNTGVLFHNDRKEKDTHPDRTGTINVEGVEYFLNGWLKDGKRGQFVSLSIKKKDKQPQQTDHNHQDDGNAPFDDAVPF